ncbi:Diaminopimelate epimerase-like protein [Auriscalpium vulgare]|uniref:Diaminopimelate epimerase-like protein n=1 Tax=Auriscalpium vulgare TaxID=40419 RepID=A0ACB8R1I8_9AGAM|nr:Diaminopimelate epimerase-like protein [Auriscalpium vulgare]
MSAETQNILPVTILNAFTDDLVGGNLAACVLLPPALFASILGAPLQAIAQSLNQPMTAFIAPLGANASAQTFSVHFFAPERESPLCGHATLAGASALFADRARVPAGVQALHFDTPRGGAEAGELRAVLARVLGTMPVVYMGKADAPYRGYVLVEVDTPLLGELELDVPALVALLDKKFAPGVAFESRVFCHGATQTLEDAVCGSAHALLAPYWAAKDALGPAFLAKQVSAAGDTCK